MLWYDFLIAFIKNPTIMPSKKKELPSTSGKAKKAKPVSVVSAKKPVPAKKKKKMTILPVMPLLEI